VKLLLDTHAFLWFVLGDRRLSQGALNHILEAANAKFVSPASHWEIAIKISIGKYTLHQPFDVFFSQALARTGFQVLPIEIRHTTELTKMPFHHRDPFDRLLAAQAISESMAIVSDDGVFDQYGVTRLW
jgi:PIN domain nuclease of toxin-antitoxin system